MTLLIDAHNHLQEEVLEPHLPAVLQRARAAGVTCQVVNGTHEGDWAQVRALAAAHPEVVPCFGLHPWFVGERQAGWCERLRELLVAVPAGVGEIGLDRWQERPDLAAQEEVFVAQLRLARELQRPAMVHCLRAWGWLREVLEREGPLPGLLIHAYGGAADMLAPLAARYAGFSSRTALWQAMLLSGGLAGLAGAIEAAGPLGQLTPHVSSGYGFAAIIVAFVGRLHPVGVVFAAILMSMFYIGGELAQSRLGLPSALTGVFQGLLLIALLACDTLIHYRVRLAR